MIDKVGLQIQMNSQHNYKYGGVYCYDHFEDCLLGADDSFNPE